LAFFPQLEQKENKETVFRNNYSRF